MSLLKRFRRILFYRRLLPGESNRVHPVETELKAKGFDVVPTGDDNFVSGNFDLLWIQGNLRWYPKLRHQLLSVSSEQRPFVLHWFHEPLPMPSDAGLGKPRLSVREIAKIILRDKRSNDVYSNRQILRQLARHDLPDLLVVSTPARKRYLEERGIPSTWSPLGVCVNTDRSRYDGERDIDVLFLGVPIGLRRRQLKHLTRLGVNVQVAGGWNDSRFWGTGRAELIARSKIFLNVSHYPGELPGLRFALGMVNRSLVVSEPVHLPAPFEPNHHFVSSPLCDLPEAISYYLTHEYEREQMTSAAYDLVLTQLTWAKSVSRVLDALESRET